MSVHRLTSAPHHDLTDLQPAPAYGLRVIVQSVSYPFSPRSRSLPTPWRRIASSERKNGALIRAPTNASSTQLTGMVSTAWGAASSRWMMVVSSNNMEKARLDTTSSTSIQ